jgi:hypothetical protein
MFDRPYPHIHSVIKRCKNDCKRKYIYPEMLGRTYYYNTVVRDGAGFKNKLMGIMVYF